MQTLTTEAAMDHSTSAVSSVGFGSTLRAEWTKFTTVRSTWISLALGLVLSVALTALLCWTIGFSWSDWGEGDRASFDPITFSMSGLLVAGIIFVVIGVNLAASEYSSGMIRQTLTTTPQRWRVLMAKILVVSVVSLIAAAIINIAIQWTGQLVFRAYDVPSVSMTDGDMVRTLIGLTVVAPAFPIIGVAMAFLLRSAAGAITAVLGMLFLPSMFGPLFPRRWQEDVLAWLPGPLTDSVSIGFLDPGNQLMVNPWAGAAALATWLVLFVGGAWWMLYRRDA